MDFLPFLLAAVVGRGGIFLIVGVLFRLFGAPIKAVIDKYLGWVTSLFVILVLGGFLALTQLGGDDKSAGQDDLCVTAPAS
jgi:uncharacterized membrane protein YedE/YeeE